MNEAEEITPEFVAAGQAYLRLVETCCRQSQQASAAFSRVYDLAPASFRREMHDKAVEMGLLPDAVDKDGNALYRLEDMAARLGISEKEALDMAGEAGIVPLRHQGEVFPLH